MQIKGADLHSYFPPKYNGLIVTVHLTRRAVERIQWFGIYENTLSASKNWAKVSLCFMTLLFAHPCCTVWNRKLFERYQDSPTQYVSSGIKNTKPYFHGLIPLGMKFRAKNCPKLLRSAMPPPFSPFQIALVATRQETPMRSLAYCWAPQKWPCSSEDGKQMIKFKQGLSYHYAASNCKLIRIQACFWEANQTTMSLEHKIKGEHWGLALLWIRKLSRAGMVCAHCANDSPSSSPFSMHPQHSLWLMGALHAHWHGTRAPEHEKSHQVWLVYFQVWTGWSLKTEPDLVSYLNSTPLLPHPWPPFHACRACLSLVGHANLSLIRGPEYFGSLGCVSISQLIEAMCLQNEKNLAS